MRTTSPNEHSWSSSCARNRREYRLALRYLGTIFVRVTSTFTVLAMAVETTAPTKQPRGRFVVPGGVGGPQRFCVVGVVARQRTCGLMQAARRSASIVCGLACTQRWRPKSPGQWGGKPWYEALAMPRLKRLMVSNPWQTTTTISPRVRQQRRRTMAKPPSTLASGYKDTSIVHQFLRFTAPVTGRRRR